jgi:hypothetical protein
LQERLVLIAFFFFFFLVDYVQVKTFAKGKSKKIQVTFMSVVPRFFDAGQVGSRHHSLYPLSTSVLCFKGIQSSS